MGTQDHGRGPSLVDADAPRPREHPSTEAVASAVVSKVMSTALKKLALVFTGFATGAGTTYAVDHANEPVAPPPVELPALVCPEVPPVDVDACRVCADYAREAAIAAGVPESTLDRIARQRLGPPPR